MRTSNPIMLLVLGPHRSGTSLTARMLECLGAVNSRNLNPANEFNPKGYFEDWDIYQFNENVLLPEMGSAWHAVSAIDWTSLSRRRYEELQAQAIGLLQQNYDLSSRLSVLKEPRISLLLPFWLEALGAAGFSVKAVCPIRDPLSVARSLTSRDQLPLTSGFLIYLRCWESILKSLQKTPAVFMGFEDILETSKSALKKVAACLHLPLPPDFERRVDDFTEHHLDRRLVHYTPGPEDHQMLSTNPASTALELFAALSKACETQDSSAAKLVCQSAANSLHRSPGYLQALDELSAKQLKHNIDLRCLQTEADTLRASLASAQEERARLASETDALRASLASAKEEHARLASDSDALRASLASAQEERSHLASEADTLRASLASTSEERSRLASDSDALRAALASAKEEHARLASDSDALRASLAAVDQQREGLRREMGRIRSSTSWKITAPFRFLAKHLRAAPGILGRLPVSLLILIRHRRSCIFDTAWYLEKNPDLRQSVSRPFVHFALRGVSEGRTPNAYVDVEYYLQRNSDAAASRAKGLVHYALFGFWQNRPCCWLFDEEHYQKQLDHPRKDLPNLLVHYFRHGWKEGKSPHPLFDARWYLETNPDVAAAGMEPLRHYLLHGAAESRNPHPLFDARWYLEQNQDIATAGIDPSAHFLNHGGLEGRCPHPCFPTRKVLERCPHLAQTGRNPLEYYLSQDWKDDPCPEATFYLQALARDGCPPSVAFLAARIGGPHRTSIIPREKLAETSAPSTDIRAIAIYLPQFHTIPENDEWWGKGFTEWTNVQRGRPQYEGHYQPHIPHPDLGFYDLNDETVLEQQAAMARGAGIEGFCFYYYWFNGRRLLNMPTDRMLATGKPDFPFCFCWANENWTRAWDGGNQHVLVKQEHSYESDERFILDMLPAFRDPRYIRVNDRPLLVVYRPGLLPIPDATAMHWRETCRREGIGEIFLAYMQMFDWELAGRELGYDAAIQFAPTGRSISPSLTDPTPLLNPESFGGNIYDYRLTASRYANKTVGPSLWAGVCPSWDNTARRGARGHSWIYSSPETYHQWLETVVRRVRRHLPQERRFIFINAWNEWAEGCHLEPDEKHGYAWLNATRIALSEGVEPSATPRRRILVVGHDAARAGAQMLLLALLKTWKERGDVECKLVLLGDGVLRGDFEDACHTVVLTDHPDESGRRQALAKLLEPVPDAILANTVVTGPFLAELKTTNAPIVCYTHELQKSIERWAPGNIMAATLAHTAHFLAGAQPVAANLIAAHGVSPANVSVQESFIRTSKRVAPENLEAIRKELELRPGEKVVFGCGTTDWRKGPDLFVQAALRVIQRVPTARFVWIGPPATDAVGEHATTIKGTSNISFIGERQNVFDYFSIGSAFFLSSREDPFPLVALEAADAGLPIVCFADAGGMPDFVGHSCGQTVPFEDVEAAATALIGILSDKSLCQSLGRTARQSVREKHDVVKGSEAVLSILERLADRESHAPPLSGRPLVSVIVPNYNHARFLEERLESITRQTLSDFEIILLDDCSTDNSIEILREFTAREPRARLLPNSKNSGSPFKQWRRGLAEAKGNYIWIAESDDSSHPELLASLVARLESNKKAIIAACCPQMVDAERNNLGIPKDWFSDIGGARWESNFSSPGIREMADAFAHKNAILNASGVLFRNGPDLIDLVDDSMRLCADWLFWVRLLSRGDFEYIARPLNYWRLTSSNARTKPPGEIEWEEGSRVLREVARLLGPKGPSEDRLLDQFSQRCDGWKAAHNKQHMPDSANSAKPSAGVFLQRKGWCPICEKAVTFSSREEWLRDHYLCSGCGSIPRERALMHVIQTRYPNWRELHIHESSPGHRGASVKLREQCKNYTATQYDPDVGFGKNHATKGYRSEDLEKQTFPDEAFDLVVTQDVMEHIFDAEAALREIHRTLKPGGAHIFTTPLVNQDKPSQRRAERKSDGTVMHLFPPEYHGNPMSQEGSLVTWHWGTDIVQRCESLSDSETSINNSTDERLGIEGEYCEVVIVGKSSP